MIDGTLLQQGIRITEEQRSSQVTYLLNRHKSISQQVRDLAKCNSRDETKMRRMQYLYYDLYYVTWHT